MEMIKLSRQQGVPVTVAEGEVILGFDRAAFARLAQKYGGPKRAPLGILAADADEYLSRHPEKAAGLPEGIKGVYVGKVRPDTVAANAGIEPGDVISGIAGKRTPTMSKLDSIVETLKTGDSVSVHFWRGQEEHIARLQF